MPLFARLSHGHSRSLRVLELTGSIHCGSSPSPFRLPGSAAPCSPSASCLRFGRSPRSAGQARGWKPISRRRRLSKTDHTVSGATRFTACSWARPVLRWALTVRGSLPRWRRSRYKTFSAEISGILTRMPSNLDAPLKTYLDHLARGELAYQFSLEAGRAVFYPRMLCPFTGSDRLEWRISKGLGTV